MNCKTELDIAEREKIVQTDRESQWFPQYGKNQIRIESNNTAQRVKLYCNAMNCKTELDITERENTSDR